MAAALAILCQLCPQSSCPPVRGGGATPQGEWALDVAACLNSNLTGTSKHQTHLRKTPGWVFYYYEAALRHRRRFRHTGVGVRQTRAVRAALSSRERRGR